MQVLFRLRLSAVIGGAADKEIDFSEKSIN